MKINKLLLFLPIIALSACGVNVEPEPSVLPTTSSTQTSVAESSSSQATSSVQSSSAEVSSSSVQSSSSDEVSSSAQVSSSEASSSSTSEASSSSDSSSSIPTPTPNPKSVFEQVNEKMDAIKDRLGQANELEREEKRKEIDEEKKKSLSLVRRNAPGDYYERYNTGWSLNNIYEDYINADYIVNITSYLYDNLLNSRYGRGLEYGKVYKGAAFMETTSSLNAQMKLYHFPTPTLSFVFNNVGGNDVDVEANWEYRSTEMKTYVPYWYISIYTHISFNFDDYNNLEEIRVSYQFANGVNFHTYSSLYDFVNQKFYSLIYFNHSNTTFDADFDTGAALSHHRAEEVVSGQATSDKIPLCMVVRYTELDLSSNEMTRNSIQSGVRETDALLEEQRNDTVITDGAALKSTFNAKYDEIYAKVYSHIPMTFNYETDYVMDNLVEDAAAYGLWRSTVVYNCCLDKSIPAFIEFDDLKRFVTQLKSQTTGTVADNLTDFGEALEANKNHYVGSRFKSGEDVYTLALSDYAYHDSTTGTDVCFFAAYEFAYEICKGEDVIVKFIIRNGNAFVHETVPGKQYVILKDDALNYFEPRLRSDALYCVPFALVQTGTGEAAFTKTTFEPLQNFEYDQEKKIISFVTTSGLAREFTFLFFDIDVGVTSVADINQLFEDIDNHLVDNHFVSKDDAYTYNHDGFYIGWTFEKYVTPTQLEYSIGYWY